MAGTVLAAFLLTLAAAVEGGQEAGTKDRGSYPSVRLDAPPVGTLVGLVVGPEAGDSAVLRAYREVLLEEGFSCETVPREILAVLPPTGLARRYGAFILPEGENRDLTGAEVEALRRYVEGEGGQLLVVYDAGLDQPLMPALTGVRVRDLPYEGQWSFGSPERARLWGFTPGKYDERGFLTGYGYGRLWYRHLRVVAAGAAALAWDPSPRGRGNIVVAERRYKSGGTVV